MHPIVTPSGVTTGCFLPNFAILKPEIVTEIRVKELSEPIVCEKKGDGFKLF